MDMSQYLGVFLDEAREHLQNLNDKLNTLEDNAEDAELINSIFRSAHTLKGSSGQMGFQNMMELTHKMEDVFDALRNHKISVDADMIDVLFEGLDHLEAMADSIEQGQGDAGEDVADTAGKLQEIAAGGKSGGGQPEQAESRQEAAKPSAASDDRADGIKLTDYEKKMIAQAGNKHMQVYEVAVDLNKDCVLKAARALMISNALEELGTIIGSRPSTEDIEKEAFKQRLVFLLATQHSGADIEKRINGISEIAAVAAAPVNGAAPSGHAVLTDYEKLFITQARDRDLQTFEVTVDINQDCVLKAARALVISNALEELGTVIGSRPSTEDIEKEAFDRRLVFLLATQHSGADIENKINAISEIAAVSVLPITISAADETAAQAKGALTFFAKTIDLTDFDKKFIARAKAKDMQVYETIVDLNSSCVLKAARALIVSNALEELGTVIGSRPSTEDIEKEAFEQRLVFLLATKHSGADIEKKINGISEIEKVSASLILEGSAAQAKKAEKQTAGKNSASQKKAQQQQVAVAKTIRVNLERIDQLLNLFEELIIDRGRLEKIASDSDNTDLKDTVGTIKRISNQLQETILNLRMEPIDSVFNRFPRMVRSLAKKLDKKVNFVVKGAETELDRTVIEELGDPLMHMIRNSMDHGIEHPDVRKERGKDPQGTLTLSARYVGNHVYVEIEDDGAGINKEKVLAKAVEKNVVDKEEAHNLTDKDIYHLLFASGFSTADKVSDISGRGVGLDVVESKIHSLGGTVEVDSAPGKGTRFTVKLPLTLSIINALLVESYGETYAVPITSIEETALKRHLKMMMINNHQVIQYQDKILPIVELDRYLSIVHDDAEANSAQHGKSVVIVHHGTKFAGLVVDRLIGYQDIVVKPLGKYLKNVPGFSGATILGDGRVALIIDCHAVVSKKRKRTVGEQA